MKHTTQIGGLAISPISNLVVCSGMSSADAIKEPFANITEVKKNNYKVNALVYIPTASTLKALKPIKSAIKINESLYLKYNGLLQLQTWITTFNTNNTVICRDFEVVFKSISDTVKLFDLHQITFNYTLINPDKSVNAEAIYVRNENLDPKTSRGTISTSEGQ